MSEERRRVRREVTDIEHRPQQLGFRQHGLRLRNYVRGRMLAALDIRYGHAAGLALRLRVRRFPTSGCRPFGFSPVGRSGSH